MIARVSSILGPVVAAAALPSLLAAQSADSAAFIIRLGQDTTGVERYVRMANRIEYSRPSLRGRSLDMLVPPGEVWRMGANNATTLATDRALQFGDFRLEPGTYSMFTSREDGDWTLVFNSQTGMSGLARDPARDVGRVPLAVTTLGESVEQFTIAIEPGDGGGAILIRWGTVQAAARFSTR